MGKFLIKLTFTNTNGDKETLEFDSKKYESLSTRSFVTNNASKPVFSVFPNEGRVIVKDTDLNLFNKAINGDFDNTYNFEVEIYKGQNLIARHIVNNRPQYNYENKTLSLNLGNEIDNYDSTNYEGFTYPLKSATSLEILANILDMSIADMNLSSTVESNVDFELEYKIPYLPSSTRKVAIDNVLQTIGCSAIQKPNKGLKFINLLGYGDLDKPIHYILPKHIKSSFVPNIILDNRFTEVKINTKNIYKETGETKVYNENFLISPTSYIANDNTSYTKDEHAPSPDLSAYGVYVKNVAQKYYSFTFSINKYLNSNLQKVLNLYIDKKDANGKYEKTNPTISVICKQIRYKYIGNETFVVVVFTDSGSFAGSSLRNENLEVAISKYKSDTSLWQKEEETMIEETTPEETTFEKSFYFTDFYGKESVFTASTTNSLDRFIFEPTKTENENSFNVLYKILLGKVYAELDFQTPTKDGESRVSQNLYVVETIPQSITVSFDGIIEEIKFDKNIIEQAGNSDINTLEFTNDNTLMQNAESFNYGNNIGIINCDNLHHFYKNGIRTGKLSCIFDNYDENKNIDQAFEIGDLVIPCKDNSQTPIITKSEALQKQTFLVAVSTNTQYTSSLYFGEYECVLDFPVNLFKIEITNNYGYAEPQYKINGKTLTIRLFGGKNGETIREYVTLTPLEETIVGLPVVYKVVDVEVEDNNGAGVQHLTLMETPFIIKTEVANVEEVSTLSLEEPLETINATETENLSINGEENEEMSISPFSDLYGL